MGLIFPQELFLINRNKTELLETGYQKSGGGADYAHPITTPLIYLPKNGGDEILTNDNYERVLESQGMYGRGNT